MRKQVWLISLWLYFQQVQFLVFFYLVFLYHTRITLCCLYQTSSLLVYDVCTNINDSGVKFNNNFYMYGINFLCFNLIYAILQQNIPHLSQIKTQNCIFPHSHNRTFSCLHFRTFIHSHLLIFAQLDICLIPHSYTRTFANSDIRIFAN